MRHLCESLWPGWTVAWVDYLRPEWIVPVWVDECGTLNDWALWPGSVVSFQFGAFHFGARQFDACQFGAFHFDAVPVRRVSVWRDASLARFTSARFPFLCLF